MNRNIRKFNIILIPCLLFLLNACNNSSTKNTTDILQISFDTIRIDITSQYLQNYNNFTGFTDSMDMFYGYNHFLHQIDIFDLTNKQCVGNIKLEREGPNGINNFGKFTVCEDVIYGHTIPYYFCMDKKSRILSKFNENEIKNFDYSNYYLGRRGMKAGNYLNEIVDCSNETLPVSFYSKKNLFLGIGLINYKTGDFLELHVPKPNIRGNFGNLTIPQVTSFSDSLIYNFPYSSSIYIYSITRQSQNEIKVNSNFINNIAGELPKNVKMKEEMEHQMTSLQFLSVKYDPYSNLFYRINMAPIDDLKEAFKRTFYMSIMDHKLNLLQEIKLPAGIFSPSYLITKQGIIFQLNSKNLNDENKMYLLQISIKN